MFEGKSFTTKRDGHAAYERVVHSFAHFMSSDRIVVDSRAEQTGGVEIDRRVDLDRCARSAMETENAALIQVRRLADKHHQVVQKENGELGSVGP